MAILAGPPQIRLDINRVSWFRFDNGRSNKRKWNKRNIFTEVSDEFLSSSCMEKDIYIYPLLRKMLVDVYLGCE